MLIKNPVFYTFAVMATILLLLSILVGVRLSQALQLIFAPYTYDITRGVGVAGSKIYSLALGVMQFGLIISMIIGVKLENTVVKRIVWSVGVVIVIIYFVFMVLGYLINNFH